MTSINTAISGLLAQQTRLNTAAGNIANMSSSNYTAKEAVLSSQGAGVSASVRDRADGQMQVYMPTAPLADINGFVDRPNISLDREIIDMKTAETVYKANISVIKTAEDMQDALLDALA